MEKQQIFVIQFADLDEFIQECQEADVNVVRVWPGSAATNSTPGYRWHSVNVQAIDNGQTAVLSLFLVIGGYDWIYGKPFGPQAERRKAVIDGHLETAESRVKEYLAEKLPGAAIRKGQIYTGLYASELQKAYWDGIEDIYKAQKETEA